MYEYRMLVTRVIDGDTIEGLIDLGLNNFTKQRVRLQGINAPEPKTATRKEGDAATEFLRRLILDKDIVIQTTKDKRGSFGRYLVNIIIPDLALGDGKYVHNICINDYMVTNGHAVYKEY